MLRDIIQLTIMKLQIITPTGINSNSNVNRFQFTSANGMMEFLPGHAPMIAEIKKEYKKLYYNQLHKLFPVVQKKHILLYVGRVVKEKNLEFLFPVLFTVKKIIPDTMLIIVGGGPELEHLKEKAKKLHCNKDVIFTGYRTKDELSYFYHTADLFVFPSKTETQGLVTLEAMMAGLPVVAIGEMGTIDVMQGDNGGFMVKDDAAIFLDII